MASPKMKRNLTSRHISMIAIGGAIGTGLFMASGAVVSGAGSYGTLFAYLLVGVVIYFLMTALGELASFYPVSGSFISYSARFIDPSLGFGVGWLYSFMWILVAGVDIITLAKILQFWEVFRNVSTFTICIVFLLILYVINLASVALFGEIEFWLTIIKVLTVLVFLAVGIAFIMGVGLPATGLKTFVDNGKGANAGLLGLFGIFSTVAFSFGGTESVAVTAGESDNPAETMPKAVNQVFWRILIFYLATMFVISATVSATDSRLLDTGNVTASPFTIVFENAGLASAAVVMNIVILTSVLSAANSGLYLTSRQLYSLSTSGYAPKFLSKLNKKSSPIVALNIATVLIILNFVFEKYNPNAYYMLLSMIGVITIIIWLVSVISHIRLRKAIVAQGANMDKLLPYKAKLGIIGSYIALIVFVLLFVLQIYADVVSKDVAKIATDLLSPLILLVIYVVHKMKTKTKMVSLKTMDISEYNYKEENK